MVSRPKARRPAHRAHAPKRPAPHKSPRAKKAAPAGKKARPGARPAKKAAARKPEPSAGTPVRTEPTIPRGDARRHVLSLSFLRDGDEFLARLETDSGQITELKNRSLDQLLTLVASELEDLLE